MGSKAVQPEQLQSREIVVTMEDHLIDGGFGSWLCEAAMGGIGLVDRIRPIALSVDVCDTVASQKTLNRIGGLSQ
jgi:transketolase